MFPPDLIQRIREASDLVEIVSGYVALRRAGQNYVGLCPFHAEKTPSFTVSPSRGLYHCFGCGEGGDVFRFVGRLENLDFPDAVRYLAERAGIPIHTAPRQRERASEQEALRHVHRIAAEYFRQCLAAPEGRAAREYLASRGISAETAEEFGLGYAPGGWDRTLQALRQRGLDPGLLEKAGLAVRRERGLLDRFRNRLMFPIRDLQGRVVGFGGRSLDGAEPKYLNSPETPLYSKGRLLYGMDRARAAVREAGFLILVEGYLDAIAAHQAGFANTAATLGTALTAHQVQVIRRFTDKVVLIYDADPAGTRATLRGLDAFVESGLRVNVAALPPGDDPDSFIRREGREAFQGRLRASRRLLDFALDALFAGRNLADVKERAEVTDQVLALLSRVTHGVERDHYLAEAAGRLGVREETLREELKKFRTAGDQRRRGPEPVPGASGRRRPAVEARLIQLMLQHPAVRDALAGDLDPRWFTDPVLRNILERVLPRAGEAGPLVAWDEDPEIARTVSALVLSDPVEDPREALEEARACRARLVEAHRQRTLLSLHQQIREAEARGEPERLARLLEEHRRWKTAQAG